MVKQFETDPSRKKNLREIPETETSKPKKHSILTNLHTLYKSRLVHLKKKLEDQKRTKFTEP